MYQKLMIHTLVYGVKLWIMDGIQKRYSSLSFI